MDRYFYGIAALVVALLVYLVVEIIAKGWGFWDPNFYLESQAIRWQVVVLDRSCLTRFTCLF